MTREDHHSAQPRILVVDLETTGLHSQSHSILQIGAVWLTGGVGEFSMDCRMWPGAKWTEGAYQVNGITQERAEDPSLPTEGEAVLAFYEWIGIEPIMLAGLNPSFDRGFVHEALRRAGLKGVSPFPHRVVDLHTLTISYALVKDDLIPSRGLHTDEIYAVLGLPPEKRPHQALEGARREAEALRMLLGMPELAEGGAIPSQTAETIL